jgi:hypothetical protein
MQNFKVKRQVGRSNGSKFQILSSKATHVNWNILDRQLSTSGNFRPPQDCTSKLQKLIYKKFMVPEQLWKFTDRDHSSITCAISCKKALTKSEAGFSNG